MDIKKLQFLVVEALEEIKGQDIRLFDTTNLTSLFDRIVIASGTSNRQTKALAASVRDAVKGAGGHIVGIEGEDTGEWVLVDIGDMIIHIMQPAIREYYRLEEIWGEKEVKLLKAKKPASRQSARSDAEPDESAPKKRARVSRGVEVSQASMDDEPKVVRKRAPKAVPSGLPSGGKVKVASSKSSAPPKKAAPRKTSATGTTASARKPAAKTADGTGAGTAKPVRTARAPRTKSST